MHPRRHVQAASYTRKKPGTEAGALLHNMSHGRLSLFMAADTADFKKGCMETTRPLMIEAACSQRSRLGRSFFFIPSRQLSQLSCGRV